MNASDIHRQSELLRETLLYLSHSPRNQAYQIAQWLRTCSGLDGHAQLHSYIREFVSHFLSIVSRLTPAGCPPAFFSEMRARIMWVMESFPGVFPQMELAACIESLSNDELTVHSWLGSPDAFASGQERARFLESLAPVSTEREILSQYLLFLELRNHSRVPYFAALAEAWDEAIRSEIGCVKVPLIENDITSGSIPDFQPFVHIKSLRVHLHALERGAREDRIDFSNIPAQNSLSIEEQFHSGLRAARLAARAYVKPVPNENFLVSVSLKDMRDAFNGLSLGLGYSAAAFSALSHLSLDKKYFIANGASVFSALIEDTGRVLPLDDGQAGIKARGLWCSPYKEFVVAKDNEAEAEGALRALSSEQASRILTVIPVRQLEDAIDNRRIIVQESFTVRQRTRKQFRRYQGRIALASAGLLVTMVLGYFLFIADFDTNPDQLALEDRYFVVKNRNGKELWRDIYEKGAAPLDMEPSRKLHTFRKLSVVSDLDKDGINEVIVARQGSAIAVSDSLYCYRPDGSVRWRAGFNTGISTTEGDYLTQLRFAIEGVALVPEDSLHGPRIVAAASNGSYTNIVNTIDTDGHKLSEYLHIGGLTSLTVYKDTLERRSFILLGGMLNGYRQHVFIVLDPDDANGVSPQRASHRLLYPPMKPAHEMYYMMFPELEFHNQLEELMNCYVQVSVLQGGIVRIVTTHGVLSGLVKEPFNNCSLIWMIDLKSMRAIEMTTSSPFESAFTTLRARNAITSVLDREYKQNLIRQILYWNGTAFVNEPTMNLLYSGAAARNHQSPAPSSR